MTKNITNSWYVKPDFSKEESELTTMGVTLPSKVPKSFDVDPEKLREIQLKIQHQLEQAGAGDSKFVNRAVQNAGNVTKPFFEKNILNTLPDRDTTIRFIKLVKQDYSYALANYFADLLCVIHENIHSAITEG
jgi:hypothetical protein